MRLREVHAVYRPVAGAPAGPRPQIHSGRDVATVVAPLLAGSLVERFGVLTLDAKHRVIGWDVVSVGTLDGTMVHPRDVFRVAVQQNAAAVIVTHNHPSGDPTFSPDDNAITQRLQSAGELMGISVLDHVVVGDEGRYASFKEQAVARG